MFEEHILGQESKTATSPSIVKVIQQIMQCEGTESLMVFVLVFKQIINYR